MIGGPKDGDFVEIPEPARIQDLRVPMPSAFWVDTEDHPLRYQDMPVATYQLAQRSDGSWAYRYLGQF